MIDSTEITLTVTGDPEGIRPLYEAVLSDPGLQDARLLARPAPAGALSGQFAEAISLLVHDSSTAGAIAAVVITWIRSQRGKIEVHLAKPGGKITVSGPVPPHDLKALNEFVSALAQEITDNVAPDSSHNEAGGE
jgi:hypothetical protein